MTSPEKPKQTRDPQRSRERLLNAAMEVFAAHGLEAGSVDEICKKAGLNKRMAYHYFGSKQELYAQTIQRVYEQFFALEVELSSMLLDPEDLLEALVRRYYMFLRDHPTFVRLISFENLNDGQVAQSLELTGQKAPVMMALDLAIQKGQASGRFRAGIEAGDLLMSIFSLCFFYFSNRHTMSLLLGNKLGARGVEKRIRHVTDLLLHGICAKDD